MKTIAFDQHEVTLTQFIEWAKTKEPLELTCVEDNSNCPMAEYAKEVHSFKYPMAGSDEIMDVMPFADACDWPTVKLVGFAFIDFSTSICYGKLVAKLEKVREIRESKEAVTA